MNKKLMGILLASQIVLAGCATSSHFGVPDRADTVPSWVGATEAAIARAEASAGAKNCPEELERARRYARHAMEVYWGCIDGDAYTFAAQAMAIAAASENCGSTVKPAMSGMAAATSVAANRTLELSAETLFGFNSAELSPKGVAILNAFLADLSRAAYDAILIVGHTDPIGPDRYNQGLSERRAQSVAQYLISSGVPSSRVHAEGRGERDLKVTYQQCKMEGAGSGKALIQCYQPNRRVTVTVTGSR